MIGSILGGERKREDGVLEVDPGRCCGTLVDTEVEGGEGKE